MYTGNTNLHTELLSRINFFALQHQATLQPYFCQQENLTSYYKPYTCMIDC